MHNKSFNELQKHCTKFSSNAVYTVKKHVDLGFMTFVRIPLIPEHFM